MTQTEARSRYAFVPNGFVDTVVALLLEAVSVFLLALTAWWIGHWYSALTAFVPTLWAAIMWAAIIRLVVAFYRPISLTRAEAIEVLTVVAIACLFALAASGLSEFAATNIH